MKAFDACSAFAILVGERKLEPVRGDDLKTKTWLGELEGLRGLAALWVFSMHVSLLSGTKIPIVYWGAYGVDLFILLSGFLMVHQFEQRKDTQKWSEARTVRQFWGRRFFRIAPLYYLLLAIAFISDPILQWARLRIGVYYPGTLTNGLRYTDISWGNILTHFSFIFGLIPHYAFQTPLPDWSIGLEMQFYFTFPLLMLIVMRWGYGWMVAGTLFADVTAYEVFHHFFTEFTMPSFLPLKIHLFLLGMLIAAAFHGAIRKIIIYILVIPLFPFVISEYTHNISKRGVIIDVLLAGLLFWATQNIDRNKPYLPILRKVLNNPICQKLGDISYSVYLVHLLVVLPVAAVLLSHPFIFGLPNIVRFLVIFLTCSLVVIPISLALYYCVEKPGIAIGKQFLLRTRHK